VDPAPVAESFPADVGIADGLIRQLDPRYIDLERQTGWIASAITTALGLAGTSVSLIASDASGWVAALVMAGVVALLVLLTWWWQRWPVIEYRHASYRVDTEGLEIRRGVYFRAVTTVPRSRVQHTDVSQGPLQRRFGLATLIVHTAGSENAEVDLPGLPHDVALKIRDHLLPRNSDNAV